MTNEQIVLVRGPIAVGKTTAVERLAHELGKVAVVPIDWLRHMVAGWNPVDSTEAILAARNAAALTASFCQEGYHVLIDGPFDEPEALATLLRELHPRQAKVVTLIAPWQAVLSRHNARPENQRADVGRVRDVYERIHATRDSVNGLWLDTGGMESRSR